MKPFWKRCLCVHKYTGGVRVIYNNKGKKRHSYICLKCGKREYIDQWRKLLLIVQKRDGRKVKFNKEKIKIAVLKAFIDVDGEETVYAKEKAKDIANYIESLNKSITVEEIQDEVEEKLMARNRKDVARKYIIYRNERNKIRKSRTYEIGRAHV